MRRFVGVLELLSMAVIAVLVALFMSAPVGWTFIFLLGVGFVFSLIVTGAVAIFGAAKINFDINTTMLYKGETLSMTVTVENHTLVPVPDVIVTVNEPPNLKAGDGKTDIANSKKSQKNTDGKTPEKNTARNLIRFAVAARRTESYTVTYKAVHWGGGSVGISSVRLGDFTGLFSFPWHINNKSHDQSPDTSSEKSPDTSSGKSRGKTIPIRVFPNIPDIPSDNPLIKSAVTSLRYDSETEETAETKTPFIQSGFPGYTHRDYEPGDPLKRINWKLSAKRGSYLIRLDDETESFRQVIVLDSLGGAGYAAMERAVETVLAIAFAMVRLGFRTAVWYGEGSGGEVLYKCFECSEQGDVKELQTLFAMYDFAQPRMMNAVKALKGSKKGGNSQDTGDLTRFPETDAISQSGSVLYVSSADDLRQPIAQAHSQGLHVEAVTTAPLVKAGDADGVWTVLAGYNMRKEN